MAAVWTTPRTWVADELVKASQLNEQLRDNLSFLALGINTATGKIPVISSTYFASLDGSNLTGIGKLTTDCQFTSGVQSFDSGSGRVVVPVGTDKYGS